MTEIGEVVEAPIEDIKSSKLDDTGALYSEPADFWRRFLENPPLEILWAIDNDDPDLTHCVLSTGYEGGLVLDNLWHFDRRGIARRSGMPPKMNYLKYGGKTLCGLEINSGRNMYQPRWRSISPTAYREEPDSSNMRGVLIDMHGITCMTCRKRLIYGISAIVEDLLYLRSTLVSDWEGKEFLTQPLVHGKNVTSSGTDGTTSFEHYSYRCEKARRSINPQLVDVLKHPERITCQECKDSLAG